MLEGQDAASAFAQMQGNVTAMRTALGRRSHSPPATGAGSAGSTGASGGGSAAAASGAGADRSVAGGVPAGDNAESGVPRSQPSKKCTTAAALKHNIGSKPNRAHEHSCMHTSCAERRPCGAGPSAGGAENKSSGGGGWGDGWDAWEGDGAVADPPSAELPGSSTGTAAAKGGANKGGRRKGKGSRRRGKGDPEPEPGSTGGAKNQAHMREEVQGLTKQLEEACERARVAEAATAEARELARVAEGARDEAFEKLRVAEVAQRDSAADSAVDSATMEGSGLPDSPGRRFTDLKHLLEECRAQRDSAQSALANAEEQAQKHVEEIDRLRKDLEESQAQQAQHASEQSQLEELRKVLGDAEAQRDAAQSALQEAEARAGALKKELEDSAAKHEAALAAAESASEGSESEVCMHAILLQNTLNASYLTRKGSDRETLPYGSGCEFHLRRLVPQVCTFTTEQVVEEGVFGVAQ